MNIKEIVQEINGTVNGKPKASLTLGISYFTPEGEYKKDGANFSTYKPEIIIARTHKYIQIELKFKSYLDGDINLLWKILEIYGKEMTNYEEGDYPLCTLTLVPNRYECEYIAVASNPIFWANSFDPSDHSEASIRICFEAENFIFYHADVDKRRLNMELERELGF